MKAPEMLFGFPLTEAEFSIILELAKAFLLTAGAAVSVLIFNGFSKKREQDFALFNEIVRTRITALHDANGTLATVITDYLTLLEKMMINVERKINLADDRRFIGDETALAAIKGYRQELPDRERQIEEAIAKSRYQIGERGVQTLRARFFHFTSRVNHHYDFYEHCVEIWLPDLEKNLRHNGNQSRRRLELLIAEIVFLVGHKEIVTLINDIHDDFEKVITFKGRSIAYEPPVNIDESCGPFRIHPEHEEIRHRLSRLITLAPQLKGIDALGNV